MFTRFVLGAFDALTPDYDAMYQSAKGHRLDDWKAMQQALAGTAGAASCAIPLWHLVTMPADAAFLVNRMSVCSYGTGAILGSEAGQGNILEPEDLPVVLARWAGDEDLADAAVGKTAASLAGKVGGKAAAKVLAKTMAEKVGLLVGKKLAGKLGAKVGAKFSAKYGGKLLGGCLPVAGSAISAGLNVYFVRTIGTAAEEWYRTKVDLAGA